MAFDFPNSPSEGQQFAPGGGPVYQYKAPAWELVSTAGCTISDAPPTNPVPGQTWWESDTGLTFIWFVDAGGGAGQWVQINGTGLPEAPSDGALYGRVSAAWQKGVKLSGDAMTGALAVGGALTTTGGGAITSSAGVFANSDPTFGFQKSGADRTFLWAGAPWYWYFENATGNLSYFGNSVGRMQIRGSDGAFIVYTNGYKPGGGAWLDSSDSRIKNVIGDYDSGLDDILALQPVRYTFKGNDTGGPPEAARSPIETPEAKPADEPLTVPYPNSPHYSAALDGQEFVGVIAQDAEVRNADMVAQREGYIDGVKVMDLRDFDQSRLIWKLLNTVKTLHARIEALEAGGAR